MKEVNNSIAEFDKHKQEYDEERVKEQVRNIKKKKKNPILFSESESIRHNFC